ncbi:TetR/AcrR family transcriptional regulator [Mycobacteroides saopaulense]|uniref:HTH tetR-type domain-containing protein n=1 Tax=Mycobacteroides saopaulense TaxID=1578165 RepID=A0ABX3C4X5_9MYCO|nr:TetR/AcrR family transcriptional regulator [Mycobacteroides saopaulense]ALR12984.1 hypothetical protein MYCSP_17970 [Mycobacteroides saopaulense]OHT88692.1 hypothetical protein BKG68_02025 [Mycobacteroides saopaulense]OHU13511.1 hypothetical protein BKG73_02030 [Mycobacteroides saopaulense]
MKDHTNAAEAGRGRGRPIKDGKTSAEVRSNLLDATERVLARVGVTALSMGAVAREAGYSRGVVYRYFDNRDEVLDALVVRRATTNIAETAPRLVALGDWSDMVVESMVIVATETTQDPLLRALVDPDGSHTTAASLIFGSPGLNHMLTSLYESMFNSGLAPLRDGLSAHDASRYVLSVVMSLLSGSIPGCDDPDQVRRYVRTFVLPALLQTPPPPQQVFT